MADIVPISRAGLIRPRLATRHAVPATTWYERGRALEATDAVAALAAYGRAVAGRPDLADGWNNLGRLRHDRGELAAAEGCYRLAICGDAGIALYWFNLGVVVEDLGRHAEAMAAYERAIELDAACADAHYNLARLCESRKHDLVSAQRAVRHYAAYRQLNRLRTFR